MVGGLIISGLVIGGAYFLIKNIRSDNNKERDPLDEKFKKAKEDLSNLERRDAIVDIEEKVADKAKDVTKREDKLKKKQEKLKD